MMSAFLLQTLLGPADMVVKQPAHTLRGEDLEIGTFDGYTD